MKKKMFGPFAIVLVLLVGAFGIYTSDIHGTGVKRINNDNHGTVSVSLSYADSTGVITNAISPIAITDPAYNTKYDIVFATFQMSNLTEITDSAANENAVDTLMVWLYTGMPYRKVLLDSAIGTLPCTLFLSYFENWDILGSATTTYASCSTCSRALSQHSGQCFSLRPRRANHRPKGLSFCGCGLRSGAQRWSGTSFRYTSGSRAAKAFRPASAWHWVYGRITQSARCAQ